MGNKNWLNAVGFFIANIGFTKSSDNYKSNDNFSSIHIHSKNSYFKVVGYGSLCDHFKFDGYGGIKVNDTFGLLIDFKSKECFFKYNGKIIQKTYTNIPDEIVAVFYPFNPLDITCVTWMLY